MSYAAAIVALICLLAALRRRRNRTQRPIPRVYQVAPWAEFRRQALLEVGADHFASTALPEGAAEDLPGRILRFGDLYTRLPGHGELPTDEEIAEALSVSETVSDTADSPSLVNNPNADKWYHGDPGKAYPLLDVGELRWVIKSTVPAKAKTEPTEPTPRFKVGDRVRVLSEADGGHPVGTIGYVTSVSPISTDVRWADEVELEPVNYVGRRIVRHDYVNKARRADSPMWTQQSVDATEWSERSRTAIEQDGDFVRFCGSVAWTHVDNVTWATDAA